MNNYKKLVSEKMKKVISVSLTILLISILVVTGCVENKSNVNEFRISNIVLCSEEPKGYMNYTEQPNALYNHGLPVWIYMNVLNEEYNTNQNGTYEIWLQVNITVKAPNGTIVPVPGIPADYHGNLPADIDPEKLFLQHIIPTTRNMSEGKYKIDITVQDKIAGKGVNTSRYFIINRNYNNKYYGFSIEQPSGWFVEERQIEPVVIFFGPRVENFSVNILILVFDAQNMTIDEFVSLVKQNDSESLTNYQLIFEGSRIINKQDAYEMVITHTTDDLDLKLKEVIFLKNNIAYLIIFTGLLSTYDEYLPVFETILETFSTS
jgi:hypothetical protein